MTPTEAVKILLEGIEEAVRHLNPQVREPVRALAALQRAALAATAEPAATCSCGFPRTAGYPRRACEACGRAATEPAKGDGILRTLDGKPMYLVGRTTDAPATAEPAVRCDECAPEWSCFNGSTPCHSHAARKDER